MHLQRVLHPAVLAIVILGLTPLVAPAQTRRQLSAREVFYSAEAEPPAAKKAAPSQASPVKKKEVASAKARPSAPPPAPSAPPRAPSGGEVIAASYAPAATSPLGLRYSILKREGSDSVEVAPDTVFRSGDRIRVRVEVNGGGYLYIIHRGSSGTWKPLFPSAETSGGDNHVEKGRTYDIPAGYVFTFDDQAGEEKLFIVLSRKPEPDLEKLIYSLRGGAQPAETAKPAEEKVLLAQNIVNIDNGLVEKLRKVYSRDLIIEKVDENSPPAASAPAKEKAVYVVNPSRNGDSRVVADVTLIHK